MDASFERPLLADDKNDRTKGDWGDRGRSLSPDDDDVCPIPKVDRPFTEEERARAEARRRWFADREGVPRRGSGGERFMSLTRCLPLCSGPGPSSTNSNQLPPHSFAGCTPHPHFRESNPLVRVTADVTFGSVGFGDPFSEWSMKITCFL